MVSINDILLVVVPGFALLGGSLFGINKFLINRDEKELDEMQNSFFRKEISKIIPPMILDEVKKKLDLYFEFQNSRKMINKMKTISLLMLIAFVGLSALIIIFSDNLSVLSMLGFMAFIVALYFFLSLYTLIEQSRKLNVIIERIKEIESLSVYEPRNIKVDLSKLADLADVFGSAGKSK